MLLETAVSRSLTSRLREQEGLTYSVYCRAMPLGDLIIWEIKLTCQPGQAPLALASLKQELMRYSQKGFTADEWARTRLQMTSRTMAAFADAQNGRDFMLRLAEFGNLPDDPMAMVLKIELDRIQALAADALDRENFVFSATGPMFEEDIEQF